MARHRYHSAQKKANVIAFYKKHGYAEMRRKYPGLASGTVYGWLRAGSKQPNIRGGKRRGPPKGQRKLNGQHMALIHLHRYAQRITLPPSDGDLDVLLAIRALQGQGKDHQP